VRYPLFAKRFGICRARRYNPSCMVLSHIIGSALHSHVARAVRWLPWLIVALLLALSLCPGSIAASRLIYQSALESSPVPELPPPPPYEDTLPWPAEVPAPTEMPAAQPPAPAPATEAPPAEAPPQPAAPAPKATAIFPLIDQPVPQPRPTPLQKQGSTARQMPAQPGISQSVVNWTKFWDTVVMWAAYPWLCCGILLLLGVPVGMLYLEIRGRRRPRILPELPRRRGSPDGPNPQQ
jgi:hypothetical protein